jgi:hypothetical protein
VSGVGLTYDLAPEHAPIEPGDLLLTPAGSAYLVLSVRAVRSRALRPWQRFSLRCERLLTRESVDRALQQGAGAYPLHWYRRKRAGR